MFFSLFFLRSIQRIDNLLEPSLYWGIELVLIQTKKYRFVNRGLLQTFGYDDLN